MEKIKGESKDTTVSSAKVDVNKDVECLKRRVPFTVSGIGTLGTFVLFMIVTAMGSGVAYIGYTEFGINFKENFYVIYGFFSAVGMLLLYILTLFTQGRFISFFRHLLIFTFFIVLIVQIAYLKLQINTIEVPKSATKEYVDTRVEIQTKEIEHLKLQNTQLREFIETQRDLFAKEIAINRKAVQVQQKIIETNMSKIESGKKYRLIKNPF